MELKIRKCDWCAVNFKVFKEKQMMFCCQGHRDNYFREHGNVGDMGMEGMEYSSFKCQMTPSDKNFIKTGPKSKVK